MNFEEFKEELKEKWNALSLWANVRLLQYALFFLFCVNALFLIEQSVQTWQVWYLLSLLALCIAYLSWFIVRLIGKAVEFDLDDIPHMLYMKVLFQHTKLVIITILLRCVYDLLFK